MYSQRLGLGLGRYLWWCLGARILFFNVLGFTINTWALAVGPRRT